MQITPCPLSSCEGLCLCLYWHMQITPTPYLVGRAKKRSGRAHEEMTENSFPKTDSKMTDWGGQIGHEQLLTRSTLVGEIVIWSRVEIDSDILPQLQEIWGRNFTIFGSHSNIPKLSVLKSHYIIVICTKSAPLQAPEKSCLSFL